MASLDLVDLDNSSISSKDVQTLNTREDYDFYGDAAKYWKVSLNLLHVLKTKKLEKFVAIDINFVMVWYDLQLWLYSCMIGRRCLKFMIII